MKPTTTFRCLALAAVLSLGPSALAQEAPAEPAVALSVRVRAGDTFRYRQTNEAKVAMDLGGEPMNSETHVVNEYTLSVLGVDEKGTTRFKVRYDRVHGSAQVPMLGKVTFDSKNETAAESPVAEMMAAQFTILAGREYELTLDPHGRVLAVSGLAAILQEAMQSSAMGAIAMQPQLADEDLAAQAEVFFQRLPAVAVRAGDEWTQESGAGGQDKLPVRLKTTFRLASAGEDTAVVDGKVAFESSPVEGDSPLPEMSVEQGEGAVVTKVSRKDGLPLHSRLESTVQMTMPNPMNPDAGSIAVTNETTVTVERLEASPKDDASESPKTGKSE